MPFSFFQFPGGDSMKIFFLTLAVAVLCSGCVVRGPSVEVPSISVEPPIKIITPDSSHHDDDHRHKSGKGCPPGLAKQGRC